MGSHNPSPTASLALLLSLEENELVFGSISSKVWTYLRFSGVSSLPIILRKLYADLLMTPGFSCTRFHISINSPSVIPCPRSHALFMTSISRTCWMIKGRISSHKTSNTCDLVPSPAPSPVSASQNGCLDFLALASFWAFASASLKRMSEDPNLEITMFKCQ